MAGPSSTPLPDDVHDSQSPPNTSLALASNPPNESSTPDDSGPSTHLPHRPKKPRSPKFRSRSKFADPFTAGSRFKDRLCLRKPHQLPALRQSGDIEAPQWAYNEPAGKIHINSPEIQLLKKHRRAEYEAVKDLIYATWRRQNAEVEQIWDRIDQSVKDIESQEGFEKDLESSAPDKRTLFGPTTSKTKLKWRPDDRMACRAFIIDLLCFILFSIMHLVQKEGEQHPKEWIKYAVVSICVWTYTIDVVIVFVCLEKARRRLHGYKTQAWLKFLNSGTRLFAVVMVLCGAFWELNNNKHLRIDERLDTFP